MALPRLVAFSKKPHHVPFEGGRGGLMDGRLGTLEPGQKCLTCGNTSARCPGHFGHIELAEPVLHIAFIDNIHKLLTATCRSCSRIKVPQDVLDEFSKFKSYRASYTVVSQKRIPDQILEKAKPAEHGVIVRTAAENITKQEIQLDVDRLVAQWKEIETLASKASAPTLLHREPEMPFRVIREEFNKQYRSVVVDDKELYREASEYLATVAPALADRIELHDQTEEDLPLFEKLYVNEQLTKALDSKVWLPSGGSLIIEHTEALTVIDVNTGKNVGSSNLEETVYKNNLEAAKEVARQLRLRDIGGIIVIDFVDMEIQKNREEVLRVFREALSRDKTRTQVLGISELGLVEMTRKRIGEGLLQSYQRAQS